MVIERGERLFDRFELQCRLGRGGEAEVWRAYDQKTGEIVALKIRSAAAPAFGHEARMLGYAGRHRNVVGLRGLGFDESTFDDSTLDEHSDALVLDLVDGRTLEAVLADGCDDRTIADYLAWLADVAAALDHLHSRAVTVVHGDITPSNVIVRLDGTCVLIDFGIASVHGTMQPLGWGTPGFRAPEVIAGEPVTVMTDIYGLGLMALRLLTGCRDPHDVDWQQPGLADALRFIRTALATDPHRRPRRAGAFVRELGRRVEVGPRCSSRSSMGCRSRR